MGTRIPNKDGFKFNLSTLTREELNKILPSTSKDRVCIVSVIGKSPLHASGCKGSLIDEAIEKTVFQCDLGDTEDIDPDKHCNISAFYDPKSHVIFLHLSGIYDTSYFVQACKKMENDFKEKTFLEIWCDLQCKLAKALLYLFSLSHIVLVVHPTATFDVSYIYLFRTLDSIRQKAIPWISDQLRGFHISGEWIQAGRPCSPRVLFVFLSCPLEMRGENIGGDSFTRAKSKKLPPIKKLEHSLEDQIYRILRKSRVITNISGNSLFAVPANQEFVYVSSNQSYIYDAVEFFLSQLRDYCLLTKDTTDNATNKSKSYIQNRRGTPQTISSITNGSSKHFFLSRDGNTEHSFCHFLWQHIDLALTKGFDDNVGRHPVPAYFDVPSAHTWFEIALKLQNSFFGEPKDSRSRSIHSSLKTALDIDVRFSEGRCGKVLPIASAAYQENLPPHYTEEYHQRKLAHALQVFAMHARGPAFHRYAQQLREDCERLWKNGHQMCEELSLTGNHCINPLHRVPDDDLNDDKSLPLMSHCSQVKLISTCDCGRKQFSREDPFDVKVANYDAYMSQHPDCCGELERYEFPIFHPSTTESLPAHVSTQHPSHSSESKDKAKDALTGSDTSQLGSSSATLSLGHSETGETSPAEETEQQSSEGQTESQHEEERDEIIISINDNNEASSSSKVDKPLTRQPSTTEYLPGMLNSESPPGLLPLFPSWSLVCLGPSSLYSHNIGLQEQPGFIPGTNFLLPWDVTVKLEHRERWPALWEGKRPQGLKGKKGGKDGSQFNVKIFIGVEYECPRGHRFMCSGPDRMLRVTSSGLVKDNAAKVTGGDMPLYFPCPCRPSKPQIAQLMRIHIVTPKAPVHVALNPRVQPAPLPSPIFYPGNTEPIKLSQSAYWVLRLPFVYECEEGPYLPPKEPVRVDVCRLLKGTYNIAEHESSR